VAEIATVLAERTPSTEASRTLTIDTTASPPEEAAERIGERFIALGRTGWGPTAAIPGETKE
jgi:hypothetical protein